MTNGTPAKRLHFVGMNRGLKEFGLLILVLAFLAALVVYFASTSEPGQADRNVPGATTGPGQTSLAN